MKKWGDYFDLKTNFNKVYCVRRQDLSRTRGERVIDAGSLYYIITGGKNLDFVVDPNRRHFGFISHEREEGLSVVTERRWVAVLHCRRRKKSRFCA